MKWWPAVRRQPSPILLGRYWNTETGEIGDPLPYEGERHALLFGPNGSGKFTRILAPNLLSLENRSLVVIDPKGELAAVTADYRRTIGDVVILNPFGLLGLPSSGFNPLAYLNPQAPTFYDDAAAIGDALIKIEGNDPHWPTSARALLVALLMWEQKFGVSKGGVGFLPRVRQLLTEGEMKGEDGKLLSGLRRTAEMMVAWGRQHPEEGGWQMASLAGRFMSDNREIQSIRSTADSQTEWLLSELVSLDLTTMRGADFGALRSRPTTIYVVLPAEELQRHSVWLRLVIASALRVLLRTPGLPVLFVLDEFYALGRLEAIERVWAEVRGHKIQMFPVLQSLVQLKTLYKDHWETFIGMAGPVIGFAPNDLTTANWMSERSGEKGEVVKGFNAGDSQSSGGRDSTSQSQGLSYQLTKRRHLLPQELMDLNPGYGRVWLAGMGSLGIPLFAPNYWKVRQLATRAQPNPYYTGTATPPLPASFGRRPLPPPPGRSG